MPHSEPKQRDRLRNQPRVVITGLGAVTPLGQGKDELWAGVLAGRSAVRRISRFDASSFRSQIAAQVDEFSPCEELDPKHAKRMDRFSQFALTAAQQAWHDAGLARADLDGERVGVSVGSALGGIALAEQECGVFFNGGIRQVDPSLALSVFVGAAPCNTAIHFGFTGPATGNGNSCASGTIAVGEAMRMIRRGEADVALAVGAEAPLAPLCFGSFALIRAMSTRNDEPEAASRPFDRDRDGFVMAEGAAALVLEREDQALARRPHLRRGARLCAHQ